MNILIVGNGFDLSHYLPTKYDHFMDVMGVIDDINIEMNNLCDFKNEDEFKFELSKIPALRQKYEDPSHKYAIGFDELFENTRDSKFIEETKRFYLIDNVQYPFLNVLAIKFKLAKNSWYKYFKRHVKDITTWIDFEQKIEEVLATSADCILEIEQVKRPNELFLYFRHEQEDGHRINERNFKILSIFNFVSLELYKHQQPLAEGMSVTNKMSERSNLNPKFCHGENLENGFNPSSFLSHLQSQLEDFIEIFNLYLELVVSPLVPGSTFSIDCEDWNYPDKIFSFNYTNTYQRIHNVIDVEYLHGSHGKKTKYCFRRI